jgi:hypothetical protein
VVGTFPLLHKFFGRPQHQADRELNPNDWDGAESAMVAHAHRICPEAQPNQLVLVRAWLERSQMGVHPVLDGPKSNLCGMHVMLRSRIAAEVKCTKKLCRFHMEHYYLRHAEHKTLNNVMGYWELIAPFIFEHGLYKLESPKLECLFDHNSQYMLFWKWGKARYPKFTFRIEDQISIMTFFDIR